MSLASLAFLFPALLSQQPGSARRCIDFADRLEGEGVAVAIGRLLRVKEGKRERMEEGEGQLGEAGQSISRSGTVFHQVSATASLAVEEALAGLRKERSLYLAVELQSARLGDGSIQRHFLLEPRVKLEEGMLALFVLEKGKNGWSVLEVLRFDESAEIGKASEETFRKGVKDCYEINRRVHALKRGLEEAEAAPSDEERASNLDKLRALLEEKVRLHLPENDALLATRAGPWEKRIRQKISDFEAGRGGG